MPTENKTIGQLHLDRIIATNDFIRDIANCGRRFFRNKGAGHDAYLALNGRRNIVWLFDDYTGGASTLRRKARGIASRMAPPHEPSWIYRCVRAQREDDALRIFPANHG